MSIIKFKFNDNFIATICKSEELLHDEILVPTTIKLGKPSGFEFKYKSREYYVLQDLKYNNCLVANNRFSFNNFIVFLRAFINNKLNTKKSYSNNSCHGIYTICVINNRDSDNIYEVSLNIKFNNAHDLILTKLQADQLLFNLLEIKHKTELDLLNDVYVAFYIGEI